MHIVFIVSNFYPYYSAVSKCVSNISELLAEEFKVTVICEKSFSSQSDEEIYKNQRIIRFETTDSLYREKLNKNVQKSKGIISKYYLLHLIIYKLIQAIRILLSKTSIKKELVAQYEKKLIEIDEIIDIIVPACMPFESILASVNFKIVSNSNLRIVPYLFDQFSDSYTLHRLNINRKLKRKNHIELEQLMLNYSYKVLAMHSLKKHFETEFPDFNNIVYTEHPLVKKNTKDIMAFKEGIKISYVGGFYKKYVEPTYLFEVYKNTKINSQLHFFVIGNYIDKINKYALKYPNRVFNHGTVDRQTAESNIRNSNILISVAESRGKQMSSKIFDYISFGKPIIHFYTADEDVNLKILERYPLCLCIKEDYSKLENNVKLFEEFCANFSNKQLSNNEVINLYFNATPDYTVEIIKSLLLSV